MICKHKYTKSNSSKYWFLSLISFIGLYIVQWSNSSLSNNSIRHMLKLNGSNITTYHEQFNETSVMFYIQLTNLTVFSNYLDCLHSF